MTNIIQAFLDKPKLLNTNYVSNPKLAKRFKVPLETILQAKKIAIKTLNEKNSLDLTSAIESISTNVEKGVSEIKFHHTSEVLEEEEIWKETKMDKSKWKFVQVYHKKFGKGFLYTANFRAREENDIHNLQNNFIDFLSDYKSNYTPVQREKTTTKPNACLIIPKQDFHFDKYDENGNNDIIHRQDRDSTITEKFLEKATNNFNLEKIVYILGSDYFNAEHTRSTTKGTTQQNAVSYHAGFQVACIHEQFMIKTLLRSASNVEVLYIAGNHDYYVGWHLVQWLAAFFKNEKRLSIDATPKLRKYIKYSDTGIMFNHGNEVKPQRLANIFPLEFKENWSKCSNFVLLTGDKHSEKAADYGGVRHYQVPALSDAKSLWDETNGYVETRVEHTAFIVEENQGITDIYKYKV